MLFHYIFLSVYFILFHFNHSMTPRLYDSTTDVTDVTDVTDATDATDRTPAEHAAAAAAPVGRWRRVCCACARRICSALRTHGRRTDRATAGAARGARRAAAGSALSRVCRHRR